MTNVQHLSRAAEHALYTSFGMRMAVRLQSSAVPRRHMSLLSSCARFSMYLLNRVI